MSTVTPRRFGGADEGLAERVETWGIFTCWSLPAAPGLNAQTLGPLVHLHEWLSLFPDDAQSFPFPAWLPEAVVYAHGRVRDGEGEERTRWSSHLKWAAWATAKLSELPAAPSVFRKAADKAFQVLDADDVYDEALALLEPRR